MIAAELSRSGETISHTMRDHLLYIGVPPANIFIRTNEPTPNWDWIHRVEGLANLRNDGECLSGKTGLSGERGGADVRSAGGQTITRLGAKNGAWQATAHAQ